MRNRTAGFTLIELMVTMVILALVATIAIPGFGRLIDNNRLVSGTNLLVSSIKLARSEAICGPCESGVVASERIEAVGSC